MVAVSFYLLLTNYFSDPWFCLYIGLDCKNAPTKFFQSLSSPLTLNIGMKKTSPNWIANHSASTVSSAKITASEDRALDRSVSKKGNNLAGLSVRNGPVRDEMDVDSPVANGVNKRKSRSSLSSKVNYKDGSDSDGEPLVSCDF